MRCAAFAVIPALALALAPAAQAASTYTLLYSFAGGTDGANPFAALALLNNTLYGTTSGGGASGVGTIFAIDPANGAETIVYAFRNAPSGDAFNPTANLAVVGGKLAGTSSAGGSLGYGAVFLFNPANGSEKRLYSFTNGGDGGLPQAGIASVAGTLYGTTLFGGVSPGYGTVFAVNASSGHETTLHAFQGMPDGATPEASLLAANTLLYGTTMDGGAANVGTVFSVNPATGAETIVYSFAATNDGEYPFAPLIDVAGTLYGTTAYGGLNGTGAVFALNPTTGAEKLVYSFKPTGSGDGLVPQGRLLAAGGLLYGTSHYGGANNAGTIFAVNPKTGKESVLHSFGAPGDGAYTQSGLTAVNGVLYGTTIWGGATSNGTVFSVKP